MFILFDRESAIRCSWYDLFIINRKLILVLVKLGIADFFYNCALAVLFILKIYFVNDLPTASSDLVGNPHNLQSGLVVLLAAGAPWIRLFIAVLQGLGSALLAVVSYCYASGR